MNKLLKFGIVFCLIFFQTTLLEAQEQIFMHKQLITDGRVWDIAFEDLNKDGSTDMVIDNDQDIDAFITNYKQANILWTNDGSGNFKKNSTDFGSNGYNADLGDLNNDGYLDVICSINGAVNIWFNRGDNNYDQSTQTMGYAESFGKVKLADMDNDQDLDIVLANRNAGGSVWTNDGKGVFSKPISNLAKSSTMCVGDIDLDGRNDIIFGNSIWLNRGNGQFTQQGTLEIEGQILGLWLNDVDKDGDLDLFYSTSIAENALILIKNITRR